MRAFFPELPPEVYPPTLQPLKASWKRKKPRWKFLRLLLMRRVSVQIHGQTSENNAQTSEGTILPLPPDIFAVSESQELQLHWKGEITGGPDLAVGSFSVPNLSVRVSRIVSLASSSCSCISGRSRVSIDACIQKPLPRSQMHRSNSSCDGYLVWRRYKPWPISNCSVNSTWYIAGTTLHLLHYTHVYRTIYIG